MRTTKAHMLASIGPVASSKMIANNTMRYFLSDGTAIIRLHNTDIIRIAPNGHVTLTTGGWQTHTTKERFNEYVPRHVAGFRIWQDAGVWRFRTSYGTFAFFEGATLAPDGLVINLPTQDNEAETQALRAKIRKFCRLVKTVDKLPLPNSGDCWLCSMRDASGKTMGEGDTSHLLEHVKEKYLHGSLLVNAMRFRGFTDEQIRLHYSMNFRDTFQRALRSYLYRKLSVG